jgi:hypothetical protein
LFRKSTAGSTAAIAASPAFRAIRMPTEETHPICFSFCYWDTIATEVIMHYEPVAVESMGIEAVQVAKA